MKSIKIASCILLISFPAQAFTTIKSKSGATAQVASHSAQNFQCLVNGLESVGYPVKFMGGYRRHGSVRASLHPSGLALDVNQIRRNVTVPRMPASEISIAHGCGLIAGAQWHDADSGHFQLGGYAGNGHASPVAVVAGTLASFFQGMLAPSKKTHRRGLKQR